MSNRKRFKIFHILIKINDLLASFKAENEDDIKDLDKAYELLQHVNELLK